MDRRRVFVHRGRGTGWWIEGRSRRGRLFMKTWWPTQNLAAMVARWFVPRGDTLEIRAA